VNWVDFVTKQWFRCVWATQNDLSRSIMTFFSSIATAAAMISQLRLVIMVVFHGVDFRNENPQAVKDAVIGD